MAKQLSTLLRKLADCSGKPYPIVIVDGDAAPELAGHSYYWTTPSGKTIVRHPAAYGYRTWYHPSTRRIEVGRGYLASLADAISA